MNVGGQNRDLQCSVKGNGIELRQPIFLLQHILICKQQILGERSDSSVR